MLIHILNNLPNDYVNIVELLEGKIGADSDPLTMIDLRHELNSKYQRILKVRDMKEEDINEDNEDDMALVAGKYKDAENAESMDTKHAVKSGDIKQQL